MNEITTCCHGETPMDCPFCENERQREAKLAAINTKTELALNFVGTLAEPEAKALYTLVGRVIGLREKTFDRWWEAGEQTAYPKVDEPELPMQLAGCDLHRVREVLRAAFPHLAPQRQPLTAIRRMADAMEDNG